MKVSPEQIIAGIDAVVPPETLDIVQEVHTLIQPQLEMIVILGRLVAITEQEGKDFIDSHHAFWPRCDYVTGLQKQFRKVFVLPINRGIHDAIHCELPPPVMPNRATMMGYLSLIDKKETLTAREAGRTR